jgi:hypothetical protein
MTVQLYEVSAEVEPQPGPAGDPEFPADCIGAFVECYVSAESLRAAIDVADGELQEGGYRVVDLEHALRIDLEEYEPRSPDHPSRDDLARAHGSSQCEFGPFDCYESRDDDGPDRDGPDQDELDDDD